MESFDASGVSETGEQFLCAWMEMTTAYHARLSYRSSLTHLNGGSRDGAVWRTIGIVSAGNGAKKTICPGEERRS